MLTSAQKTEYELLSRAYLHSAVQLRILWSKVEKEVCTEYPCNHNVSGIGGAQFAPDNLKDFLRKTSGMESFNLERSLTYWKRSGRQRSTWIKLKESFYHGK